MMNLYNHNYNKEDVFEKTILINEYFRMGMNHAL